MYKRMLGAYCAILLLMTVVIFRVYQINMSSYATMASQVQGTYALALASARGVIYDRNMKPFVNQSYKYVASILPTPQSLDAVLKITDEAMRDETLARFQSGTPFAMTIPDNSLHAKGIDVFRVPERYGEMRLAPHLIGYLGAGGANGVAGLERAYDGLLESYGTKIEMLYQVDAVGHVLSGGGAGVRRTGDEVPSGGIVLTLEKNIQIIAQNALAEGCERGAAVVLDVYTGDIIAMASLPAFDQNDIAASLEREDAPFINRAISGFNIGSVFKLMIASAALESGYTPAHRYTCQGYVDIGGRIFRCNNHSVHGDIDMSRALQVSCNTYFIDLGMRLDPRFTLALLDNIGFGRATELSPGLETQTGNLPDIGEFINPAAAANFSFGQGSSLATPLQMAAAVASIANGGMGVVPRLVTGTTPDGLTLENPSVIYSSNRVLSEKTAAQMQALMVDVVEKGSGRTAKPVRGGAGGKTSSAQTGHLIDGVEEVHAWFAGFYPAQKPRYSIVVFVEGGVSGETVAGPIFKRIADGIGGLLPA